MDRVGRRTIVCMGVLIVVAALMAATRARASDVEFRGELSPEQMAAAVSRNVDGLCAEVWKSWGDGWGYEERRYRASCEASEIGILILALRELRARRMSVR